MNMQSNTSDIRFFSNDADASDCSRVSDIPGRLDLADCKVVVPDASGVKQESPTVARLESRDVAFSYPKNRAVLKGISADIMPGSFLAIIGENGCGKSTFLDCLDAVLAPQRGTIRLDGSLLSEIDRTQRAQRIAYVAQHSHANRFTVYDTLLLGRKPFMKGAPQESDYAAVDEVIARMGMEELALCYIDELSGGEYQKVVIARAFVQCSDVLLLDEPTNNLDLANQHEVLRLVRREIDEHGIAAVAVMHDINLALCYCDRFVALASGEVVACGGEEVVTPQLLERVYGVQADIIEHAGHRIVVVR